MAKRKHPMQPLVKTKDGVVRFKENAIVRFLLDWASPRGMDLNVLATMPFDCEDREQFAQLIGYSVSGFGDLSYASKQTIAAADAEAAKLVK